MKIVNVVQNYLPEAECDELNAWVRDAIANDKLGYGITTNGSYKDPHREPSPLRYTSRMYAKKYEYPQLVRDIHARIEQEFNLSKWHEPVHLHGRDGVVVSATLPGGDVYLHKDPMATFELDTLRCNIITSETQGGMIHVGKERYKLKKGDMMQYLVSRHEHKVEPIIGKDGDMRILWMFGWCVDGNEWEESIQGS
jgi:hypothetical protein